MEADQMIKLLLVLLGVLVTVLFALVVTYVTIKLKNKAKDKEESEPQSSGEKSKGTSNSINGYNRQSVFNFMEFDSIDDNMIIQKNGSRFLMVVECQGVNYDLMSGIEKTSVEEGFIQFLNTLRHPVQIYTQTRSINLESSIETYKEKVKKIEEKLLKMRVNYEGMRDSGTYTQEQLNKAYFELTKQTNLYEYGKDIIYDTEKMSLNRNILNKQYYIIIPYYSSELGSNEFDKEEIKNIAFSELYTRAQSTIRSISSCGVKGKILRSDELVELLYMAYNRDEAEVFGLDRALKAGYDEIYTTAPDVLDKRMREIDTVIEQKAVELVNEKLQEARTEKQKEVEEKQDNLNGLINLMAKSILEENKNYIGEDVANRAIDRIESTEEGGSNNEETKTKTRTRKVGSN